MPLTVPSVTHSPVSRPLTKARKKRRLPAVTKPFGREPAVPGARSAKSAVPTGVPSVRHSSMPALFTVAAKYAWLPSTAKPSKKPLVEPAWKSARICVPATVPSLDQTSSPCVAVLAVNTRRLPSAIRLSGLLPLLPGCRSNCVVEACVPLVTNSSTPAVVVAVKNSLLPTGVSLRAPALFVPGFTSTPSCVPTAVPFVRTSSRPALGQKPPNQISLFQTTASVGDELPPAGLMSRSTFVPACVPSLNHGSAPSPPPVARKKRRLPNASISVIGVSPRLVKMSAIRCEPTLVPSLTNSSLPTFCAFAWKTMRVPSTARLLGLLTGGFIGCSRVPAAVPLLIQICEVPAVWRATNVTPPSAATGSENCANGPCTTVVPATLPSVRKSWKTPPLPAPKYAVVPATAKACATLPVAPGAPSARRFVPAVVPFDAYTSRPESPSFAQNSTLLPKAVMRSMAALAVPAATSFTLRVPATVPSVRHSSRPRPVCCAVKKS